MYLSIKCLVLFCTALFIVACNGAADENNTPTAASPFDNEAAWALLKNNAHEFMTAFKEADSVRLANFYTEDSWTMPPNSEPVPKTVNANMWAAVFRLGLNEIVLDIKDVTGNDDLLVETGLYEIYAGEHQQVDRGKYLIVWKKENEQWKMYRDIWNTSQPPPAP
ncbi:MAG TPA: nuclear transport factor 2 family protein [Phnomibacter sp.]|nr:nuclear transport factor 2 family protein [Phnomibacter sp.]